MNVYYGCSVYRYPSLLGDRDDHKTPEDARAADRALAVRIVTATGPSEFEAAMAGEPRADLVKALRWLADEIGDAALRAKAPAAETD